MPRLLLTGLLLLFLQPAAAQPDRRPMTTDDGLDMVLINDAVLSPDGSLVLFERSTLNWAKNKRDETIYAVPATGGEPYPFLGQDGGSDLRFSPDGAYLAFKRTVDKKAQLFVMRTAGGEARQLTKHRASVGPYRWSPDGTTIYFVSDDPRPEKEQKEYENGADAIVVDEGPNGQTAGRWRNLWSVAVELAEEPKTPTRLTKEAFRIGEFDVAPDGRRIVFTARTENRRNQANRSEIYLLTLADTTHVRLTDNEAPESDLRWAPDGRRFAYSAPDSARWELRQDKLWIMDPDTRARRMVSGAFEGTIYGYEWTPDGTAILFTGLQRTNSNLYRLSLADGTVTRLTDVTGTLRAHAFSRDRSRMVYTYQTLSTPPDLYTSPVDRFEPTRLTTANPTVTDSLLLAEGQVIRWTSYDGLEIEGLLMLPPGYEAGTRVPLLLHIHGGPAGVFTNSFRPQYQVWAGLGYAQLMPNVRGSSGYSDDLLRGNMYDIGDGDYEDLMSGVDYVIEQGYVDPERMGVRGWSYGGILGGRTITRTDRFKAASLGAGVYDWTSEYGPGFNHDVRLWYIGGTPWDNPDAWRDRSTLTHVKQIDTPVLLLHGMSDPVDTEPQSMMLFAALKDLGKPVRYIRFPREPHGFREPRHQRTRDVEEIRWMQRYVLGQDWTPWERKAEPAKDRDDASTDEPDATSTN
ncbi:MAG: S9 family peptidase [Bacteroidetes bacterium]|nr:MAG: S9 family peptidase [Bacteroidota bacterium]